jgi:mannosylglycoprotein endo-beta-mannosidase
MAPGPDGFLVAFFKTFWSLLKPLIQQILNDFALGRLDISRLNFGVLSLLSKVPGADSIKLFHLIALINVIFKFISKAFAIRLSPIAHRVISPTQTAFIKGRLIHDGALALHEIIDEIKFSGQRAVIQKLDFEKAYDRVSWAFLRTVLSRKGFEGGNVHRLMQLVTGAQTAIAINGEIGPFFRNRRGVHQGDRISPLLFNFMADALSAMIDAASNAGHIKGVVPNLVQGGVTHLQYADDTILLLELDDNSLINLKFILIAFEILSGLKINFLKSEVIVMGASQEVQARVTNALNCKQGSFPFTYLGFPIADRQLSISDWEGLVGKVGHRVDPWQGRFMSSAARLTLINSSLSSLTLYAMGLFLLADGIHASFDKILARFFWEGISDKRSYHWVNCPEVCRPKDQGGLGIINSRLFNAALMIKWIWRIFDRAEHNNLWFKLLRAKYMNVDNIFAENSQGGSQFWRSLHKIKHLFKLGAKFLPGSGERIFFWTDWWHGDGPLAIRFSRLFDICSSKSILVAQALPISPATIQFRRFFGPEEVEAWELLVQDLQ